MYLYKHKIQLYINEHTYLYKFICSEALITLLLYKEPASLRSLACNELFEHLFSHFACYTFYFFFWTESSQLDATQLVPFSLVCTFRFLS